MKKEFIILVLCLVIFGFSQQEGNLLVKELESKAFKIKSYYYERLDFTKDQEEVKEKEIFIEGMGVKSEMLVFPLDGNKKLAPIKKIVVATERYIKHYDLSTYTLYLVDLSKLTKEFPQLLRNNHPFYNNDIRKPFNYGGIKDDNPKFIGEKVVNGKVLYLFQTKYEKLDKKDKKINFYDCQVYLDKEGFLRWLLAYNKKGELIYEEKIVKIIKNPSNSSLNEPSSEGFKVIDKTPAMRELLQLFKELKNKS
jgi:hypothetical protein